MSSIVSLLVANTSLFTCGTVFIGRFATHNQLADLISASVFLVAGNTVFIQLVRHSSFGFAVLVSSMMNFIFICFASWLFFNESVRTTKIIALVLAVTAVALYNISEITPKKA